MPTVNPIVLENEKPGAPPSEWMLQPGQASASIEGFTTNISTNVGNTVDFKINTDSSHYRIDIYRLGYYGGDGATLVTSLEHAAGAPINQPAPLTDPSTGLIDAGNWQVTDTWNVPAAATSGVYIAKLVREDGTPGENLIPFVVTDNSSHSDLAFQTSDQTWQAYNAWGGNSLYTGAFAVSYNRPIDTPVGPDATTAAGPWDYILGVELPAIFWLEQNGYDVTYESSLDVATQGQLLLNHKAFISAGHDEYWSGEQRANVVAARDAGVSLNFWSGDEVYWETEFLPSIATGEANRTLVTYKTTGTGVPNPDGTWTGLWRDPAGGGVAENALSGQMYLVDWDKTTPLNAITIPSEYAQLRIWRNTAVAKLQPGEVYTTAGPYLGYEWDVNATSTGIANNGLSPAGLIPLSSTTVETSALAQDYLVHSLGPGTATHNLTLYRAPSGALVFGAGSVMWAWSLSSLHTAGPPGSPSFVPVDPAMQQAMVNLLAGEGVQPGSLEASLTIASKWNDGSPPASAILTDTTVPVVAGQPVTITGTATDTGGGVVAGVEVSTDGGNTWHEASLSSESAQIAWSYTWTPTQSGPVTALSRAVDDSANLEHAKLGTNFEITDFYNNFAADRGWSSPNAMRVLADINGDGKADLVGFGDGAVYAALGQGSDAQYNGGASFSPLLTLAGDLSATQGYGETTERGVDFVGNFSLSSGDHFATLWGVGPDGLHYDVAVGSRSITSSGAVTYKIPQFEPTSRVYGDFGIAQGWTPQHTVDVAFLGKSDPFASIIGFGDAGLLIGPEAFSPAAKSTEVYLAAGSQTLGNSSGWDSTLDIRSLRNYQGNIIDLNGDGIPDFIGMGPSGLEYALGQNNAGIYSLGPIQIPQIGVSGSGPEFGRQQGWDNTSTLRYIADVNHDGHPDIIGFGAQGVYVALGQQPNADGSGAFQQAYLAMADFGTDHGWSIGEDTRVLGNPYGDGSVDIIGYGLDNTFVAKPTIDPATGHVTWAMSDVLHAYATNEGFAPGADFRTVADISGNGQGSLVVAGATNTQIVSHLG